MTTTDGPRYADASTLADPKIDEKRQSDLITICSYSLDLVIDFRPFEIGGSLDLDINTPLSEIGMNLPDCGELALSRHFETPIKKTKNKQTNNQLREIVSTGFDSSTHFDQLDQRKKSKTAKNARKPKVSKNEMAEDFFRKRQKRDHS